MKYVSAYFAASMALIWVACGNPKNTGPTITHVPNKNKIEDFMARECPRNLGKFEDANKEVIEFRQQGKTVLLIQQGKTITISGEPIKPRDGREQITGVCAKGQIILSHRVNNVSSKIVYTLTEKELVVELEGRTVRAKRLTTVMTPRDRKMPDKPGVGKEKTELEKEKTELEKEKTELEKIKTELEKIKTEADKAKTEAETATGETEGRTAAVGDGKTGASGSAGVNVTGSIGSDSDESN